MNQVIEIYAKKHPGLKVVVVTHHAPSIQSMVCRDNNTAIVSAYVSNLENFIMEHPEIKLWCHGHLHQHCDYKIGECRVISNPRGYVPYQEHKLFNENLIIEV